MILGERGLVPRHKMLEKLVKGRGVEERRLAVARLKGVTYGARAEGLG